MGRFAELDALGREPYFRKEPTIELTRAAAALGGEVSGDREVIAPSPGCGPDDRSLVVRFGRDGRPFVYGHEGSLGGAIAYVRAQITGQLSPGVVDGTEEKERKQRAALNIWDQAMPIKNSPAERYLRQERRILDLPPAHEGVLRFHPECPWGTGKRACMVALFRHVITDKAVAIHRTCIETRERRTLGPIGGAAIKLWPARQERLVVGEGIETVLSGALCVPYAEPLTPAWALGFAGNLSTLPVLPEVELLVILVDNDGNRAGQKAANTCTKRWCKAGRTVKQLLPRKEGEDFNDIAKRMRP
jgi:putative DNA primase/helicase